MWGNPTPTLSLVLFTQDEIISVWDTLRCWGQNAFLHIDVFYNLEHQLARTVKQGLLVTASRVVRDYHPRWQCQDLSSVTDLLESSSWAGISQEGPSDVTGMINLDKLKHQVSPCVYGEQWEARFILIYGISLQLRNLFVARLLLSESSWHILEKDSWSWGRALESDFNAQLSLTIQTLRVDSQK